MVNFDCDKQTSISKKKRPERPTCQHGFMASKGRKSWICKATRAKTYAKYKASPQGKATRAKANTKYKATPQGKATKAKAQAKYRLGRSMETKRQMILDLEDQLAAIIASVANKEDANA